MSLSKRDIDDLRPTIDQLVSSFLGFSESSLVTASLNCISSGYDNDRTVGELCTILEETQAHRFSQQLFNVYDEYKAKGKSRKRKEEIPEYAYEMKKPKLTTDIPVMTTQPSPGQLTSDKIKEMMQDARKMIQQRKVELNIAAPAPAAPPPVLHSKSHLNDAMNKNKRAADLHSRIQEKLAAVAQKSTLVKPQSDEGLPMQQLQQSTNTTKPQPLILDEKGQTIDATTGEAIKLTHHTPTLKANIRAKRREEFKAVIEKPPEEVTDTAYFDPRVSFKSSHRGRRKFAFNERGKYEKLASRLRTKAQLEKLQADISKAAKKTGIASATKLASIHTSGDQKDDSLPEVEWWDSEVLQSESYFNAKGVFEKSQIEGITNLVEHPIQLRPPSESTKPVPLQVILTKKERRKLRRQNRGEAQKELQEKVRLGLLPPAEPKVRMANLMRVLGNEAIQDPTKVEAHVRAQMAKRQKAHEEANAARKLTKDQKRDKKAKKLQEDTSLGLHVAVYRVKDLNNPARKFKIEANANQLYMTGIVVCYKECNIVVVEGGPKQQKKFKRLMLHRIKWNDDSRPVKDEDSDSEEEEEQVNSCECVWEGQVKNRSFGELKIKVCPTERYAREHFIKHGVEHYWNFVYSDTILKTAGTDS